MDPDRLLRWYDARRRDLPWRARPIDPYRIWLSEIMLQQTRVETVLGYYERFLERFPTVIDLADASLDEVLALWSGLGYYARARNLHAAARAIRDRHAGRFPSDPAEVRALPGIGRYTAGAILSMAFDAREPVVDGNVVRVLARQRDLPGHAKERSLHDACWDAAASLVPAERPGDFNQALMELGATVCTPTSPRCGACPLAESCAARAAGRAEDRPAPPPRARRPHRFVDCALVVRAGRVLVVRRPDEGLLGGLWELPSAPRGELAARVEALGVTARLGRRLAAVEHTFTHFDMTLTARAVEISGEPASAKWLAPEELPAHAMSAAMRRVLDAAAALRAPGGSAPAGRSRRASRTPRRRRSRPPARRPSR